MPNRNPDIPAGALRGLFVIITVGTARFNSKPFTPGRAAERGHRNPGPVHRPEGHTVTAAPFPPTSDIVRFSVSSTDAAVRVTAVGEVDSSSAPLLRAELDTVLDGGQLRELVIDLDGVTFIDSAGLSVLAGAHRRAAAAGVRLRVLASGRAVIRPLQITGLWDLLGAEQVEPGTGSAA
jgi:anti-sigma B factor antagonist